jgi:hypothetical protein
MKGSNSLAGLIANLSFQGKQNQLQNSLNPAEDPPEVWTYVRVKAELADCQSDENSPEGGMEQE